MDQARIQKYLPLPHILNVTNHFILLVSAYSNYGPALSSTHSFIACWDKYPPGPKSYTVFSTIYIYMFMYVHVHVYMPSDHAIHTINTIRYSVVYEILVRILRIMWQPEAQGSISYTVLSIRCPLLPSALHR